MISELCGTEDIWPTSPGRRRTPRFVFKINNTEIEVDRAQIEVDACFEGKIKVVDDHDNKKQIDAKDCFLTSYHGKNCKFSTHQLTWNHSEVTKKTKKELSLRFSLVNVFETMHVEVETDLGVIFLQQYENHEKIEALMRDYKVPLITSVAILNIKKTNDTIKDLIKKATNIIRDFLKVTSLSQTCWHDWPTLDIYEQIGDSDQGKPIYVEMRTPKLKPPHHRQLTMPVHSRQFVTAAWKGYSHENDKFGFDYALEWYIESNSVQLDVIRFVLATTCLELLVSKFYALKSERKKAHQNNEELYSTIKGSIVKILKEKNIGKDTKSKILQSIAVKPTYEMKTYELLDYWGISISDIKTSISEIVKIRDNIIHRGMYFHDKDVNKALKVIMASEDLFHILTRIFLAMLKYDEQYYYPRENKWIKFDDVCSKIGVPDRKP